MKDMSISRDDGCVVEWNKAEKVNTYEAPTTGRS